MVNLESEYPTRVIIEDSDEAPINTFSTRNRCCCFPSSSSSSSTTSLWEKVRAAESNDKWWALPYRAFKKLREWSEIVAGPRWKTFIRRFNRHNRNNNNHRHGPGNYHQFQYDPMSYALNFDDGSLFEEDPTVQFPDFSTRFAAIPGSARASVDLGK